MTYEYVGLLFVSLIVAKYQLTANTFSCVILQCLFNIGENVNVVSIIQQGKGLGFHESAQSEHVLYHILNVNSPSNTSKNAGMSFTNPSSADES